MILTDNSALSTTLNLSPEDGEKWIVNLIRDSHIDAKIDLKQNILLRSQPPAPAPLIDLTRGLAFRSQAIQYAMAGRKRRE
jgi:translation initiation factor 3 subunit E